MARLHEIGEEYARRIFRLLHIDLKDFKSKDILVPNHEDSM